MRVFWKDQADLYRADDQQVMESGVAKFGYEELRTDVHGKAFCLRTSKVPLKDSSQKTIDILGTYEDITEHKKIEDALKKSEEKQSPID